jgi:phosphoglycolate phosphatase-like HAD superfamily hydrolase
MSEEIVIFDIDGMLADVSECIHHIKKKPKKLGRLLPGDSSR